MTDHKPTHFKEKLDDLALKLRTCTDKDIVATSIGMEKLAYEMFESLGKLSDEVLESIKFPVGFRWINKIATVKGEDFSYNATVLCSFPKSSGKIRYIVEDNGRLFIQRREQIVFQDDEPSQTIGQALELHHMREKKNDPGLI
jgi:hypothetical protein